jgi:predicted membrane GTPase involved in stress response
LPGNIVGLSGFEDVDIGETIAATEEDEPLPFVEIDPPTVMMSFAVNDGPFAGTEGSKVTSREIRDRLIREGRTNVSIKGGRHRQRWRIQSQRARCHASRRRCRANATRRI